VALNAANDKRPRKGPPQRRPATAWTLRPAPGKIPCVPSAPLISPEDWIHQAVLTCWPGARVSRVEQLQGDVSMRRYWRGYLESATAAAPRSVVMADLGPHDLPRYARELNLLSEPLRENLVLNAHRLMSLLGVAVPAIYLAAPHARKLLLEDLGNRSLRQTVTRQPDQVRPLFRLAIDELLKLHGARDISSADSYYALGLFYDTRLFRWEMEQFLRHGLAQNLTQTTQLGGELDRIALELGSLPRVLSHRDYHFNNLMVQESAHGPRLRVIDYQDALMAPAVQDLAVLLTTRDSGSVITPALEEELLAYYRARAHQLAMALLPEPDFARGYWLCVLQHALKVIGLFSHLGSQGKLDYAALLPAARAQARRASAVLADFPALAQALEQS